MPARHRVAHQGEHDRHALRRVLRGLRGCLLAREDQVDARLDEGRGGRGHRVQLPFGEADVERHVAPVFDAELLEPGLEPFDGRMARRPRRVQDADPERARSLLRLGAWAGSQRRIATATEKRRASLKQKLPTRGMATRDTNWW